MAPILVIAISQSVIPVLHEELVNLTQMLFATARSSLIVFPQRESRRFATSLSDSSLVCSKADFNESVESTVFTAAYQYGGNNFYHGNQNT